LLTALYEIGTVIVSETVESSKSVTVASLVNATSVTVAVHIGFGQEPAGAVGVFDVTVKRAEPFLGVAKGPLLPVVVVAKL
jgi:ethanolamine utilization microcompartment shell protein EutS